MVPAQRVEMATQDMDAVAELVCQLFMEHQAQFRCPDPSLAEAGTRSATAASVNAARVSWGGGLAAAAFLSTFPNTAMGTDYLRGPGWVSPSAVRTAAEFLQARAGEPVTTAEAAEAAGVTARALRYAFPRSFGVTPAGYLRRVRLENARQDLCTAAPGDGVTAAAATRWGWASQSQFAAAYRQRFGEPPGRTPRT
jgi:AraC-like DNA-binding protein